MLSLLHILWKREDIFIQLNPREKSSNMTRELDMHFQDCV